MTKIYSYILFVAAAILWGASFAYQLPVVREIGAVNFTFYTFFISFVLLLTVSIFRSPKIMNRWRNGLILGLFLAGLEIFQMLGLKAEGATVTSFVTNFGMVIVPFIGILLFRHKLKKIHMVILAIGCVGIYFLTGSDFSLEIANNYLLISAIFMALYFLFSERYSQRYESDVITTLLQSFFVVSVVSLYFVLDSYGSLTSIPIYSQKMYITLLVQSFIFTILPYALVNYASEVSEDIDLSYFNGFVEPLAGGAFAWYILGERLTSVQLLGASIVMVAFALGVYGLSKRRW